MPKNDQNIRMFLKVAESKDEIDILCDHLRNGGRVCDNLDEVYAKIHGFPYGVTAADVYPSPVASVVEDAAVDAKKDVSVTACAAPALACAATSTEELASNDEVTFDLPRFVWGDAARELSSAKPIWMIKNKKKLVSIKKKLKRLYKRILWQQTLKPLN